MRIYSSAVEKRIGDRVFVLCSPVKWESHSFWIEGTVTGFSSNKENIGIELRNIDRNCIVLPSREVWVLDQ